MDVFAQLRTLKSVERVSGLKPDQSLLNCLFFICPRMTGKGFRLNEMGTGLKAAYAPGSSGSTVDRIARVRRFVLEAEQAGLAVQVTAILAAADALILYPVMVPSPEVPDSIEGISVVSNLIAVRDHLELFGQYHREQPWTGVGVPQRFVTPEQKRLSAMLPGGLPPNVIDDFVRRILAGFALDGWLLSEGVFGANAVLLGVESPGVAVLQSAVSRVSVVQLR